MSTAVAAWQDIIRIDIEGIWLDVVAVAIDHQHVGRVLAAYGLTIEHLRTVDRDGDHLAGLVHPDNGRSQRLLTAFGWNHVGPLDDYEL